MAKIRRTSENCNTSIWRLSGWWLSHSSEKYESHLGWSFPLYGKIENVPNHQPVMIQGCSGIWAGPQMTRTLSVIGLQRLDKKSIKKWFWRNKILLDIYGLSISPMTIMTYHTCLNFRLHSREVPQAQIEPQSPCCMLGCQGCALRPQNAKDWMQRIVKRVGYGRIW